MLSRRPAAALLSLAILPCSCGSPSGDQPAIQKPLDYLTVYVDLPGCAIKLPPVHDLARCSADEIGTRIDAKEVCRLLTGLREWAGPSNWGRARSSCVYDTIASWPHRSGEPSRRVLALYVDVPDNSEVWFAQQVEGKPVDYFVSPR